MNYFTRFLRIAGRRSVVQNEPGTSRLRSGSDDGASPRPDPRRFLRDIDELGEFKRVLTSHDSAEEMAETGFRVSDDTRQKFAVVDTSAGAVTALAVETFFGTPRYATLLEELRSMHFSVTRQYVASAETIASLHSSKRKSKKEANVSTQALKDFRDFIEHGDRYRTSDMHVEVRDYETKSWIYFRVNGTLRRWRQFEPTVINKAFSAAFGEMSGKGTNSDSHFQTDDVRQTLVPIDLGDHVLNLRWISYPCWAGYDITIRFLKADASLDDMMTFEQMGYEDSQTALLLNAARRGGGMTAFTGPTGSGKTTAERTLTYNIPGARERLKKGISVELPLEYPRPWMSQLSVQTRVDDSPEKIRRELLARLRVAVRADPDYLAMTEIKDEETAMLLSEFTLSGHPTFTSLHGDSCIDALIRLVGQNLRVPREYLGSNRYLNTLVQQYLMPVMCPDCRRPANDVMSKEQLDLLKIKFGLDTTHMFCEDHDGCPTCRLDGLEGGGTIRPTVVAEILPFNSKFRALAAAGDWAGLRQAWLSTRTSTAFDHPDVTGKTVFEHALLKASRGEIDPRRINDEIEPFETFEVFNPGETYGIFPARRPANGVSEVASLHVES